MITRTITSAVYDSASPNAKIISFEFNLYADGDTEKYLGGFAVGPIQSVHRASCDGWCDPLGAAYVSTMSTSIQAGTAIKTDLTLTEVATSETKTANGVTKHTERYKS